jgi:hypothetical protein
MKRSHRLAYGGAALVVAAAVLSVHLVAASGNSVRSGRVRVVRGNIPPPGLEVRGDVLVGADGRSKRLDVPAAGGLLGSALPIGAVSPDGKTLAYNSFHWNRSVDRFKSYAELGIDTGDVLAVPAVRLRDLASGRERPLEPGSMSVAWRADGALAYVRGEPPAYRANLAFTANVVVRFADGRVEAWTSSPDRYEVVGWAGRMLLVQREVAGGTPDLLAFDAPGSARTLASSVLFLAISPDGTRALVAQTAADDPHPRIRLLRVADGSEIASIPISDARDPVTDEPLLNVYGPADWRGERAVMPSETGLLVLRIDDGLRPEQMLHIDAATMADGSLLEPRFAGDRTIVAWGGRPETRPNVQVVQYSCNRFALTCTRSAAVAPADAPRPLYDLSGGAR